MVEWNVRVFGPEHQIQVAVECLHGCKWAIEQSDREWYLKSRQDLVEGNGLSIADEAAGEVARINTVYEVFNPALSA